MTVVVTVLIPTDAHRAREVETEHAAAHRTVLETARKHGMLSHRRLYRDGEVLDIDEWESVDGRERFLAEAAPYLQELREARGSAPATSKVWQLVP
jgi:hypothetical protein